MIATSDRWSAFLEGARRWIAKRSEEQVSSAGTAGRFARTFARKLRQQREYLANAVKEEEEDDDEAAALQDATWRGGGLGEEEEKRAADFALWGSRYFEGQEDMKCGRHAVNNLIGGPQFIDQNLESAGSQVCAEYGEPRSMHMSSNGWYSHSVLAKLFDVTSPPLGHLFLRPATESDYHIVLACDDYYGLLVNKGNVHWASIVLHARAGKLFYVDSCYFPTVINLMDLKPF
jgi:hypothetical protein